MSSTAGLCCTFHPEMVVTRRMTATNPSASEAPADDESIAPSASPSPSGADDQPEAAHAESTTVADDSDPAAKSKPKKKSGSDFIVRGVVGLIMSVALTLVVLGGHLWVCIAVIAMEIGMFREILGMGYKSVAAGGRIPLWTTTGWYFFFALQFLFYGKSVLAHFEDQGVAWMRNPFWQYCLRHHTFLSFVLYCAGCVGFVLSLKQGQYAYQFSYFGRALAALVLVSVQSHFMILNVRQGLVWFLLPAALVIINDSFAYFVGRAVGRHSLTSLSPKKTWEGYIGAGFFTMAAAYFFSGWLINFPQIVCPKYEFTDCVYYCPAFTCDPLPSVFLAHRTEIELLPGVLPSFSFEYIPFQLHAMALGLFASVIAPFGGFMASGAKRAFGLSDFGDLFPGHGGVTDRVDCQLLMAVFTYVYVINYAQVNFIGSPDVGKLMSLVYELSTSEQLELHAELAKRLTGKGVLPVVTAAVETVADAVSP